MRHSNFIGGSFSEERAWRAASRQFTGDESIATANSDYAKIADDGRGSQAELGHTHGFDLCGYCESRIRAIVILAFEPRSRRSLPTVVLASWQATSWSARAVKGHRKRRQEATEDGRESKMCYQAPHEDELHP
jgi:hypothetical protein